MNLQLNSYVGRYKPNIIPWNEDKNLTRKIDDYSKKYFDVIENRIYNYLLKSKKSEVGQEILLEDLVNWLLSSEELKGLCSSPYDKRIIAEIAFKASLLMKKNQSRISFIWGAYSLKKIDS